VCGDELAQQGLDAVVDVVADGADRVEVLAGGVGELPVGVAPAGEDGAGVAAARGDDDVGGFDGVGGELLGERRGQVDADLVHRGADGGADLVGGCGARGPDLYPAAGVVVQQGGHL
jgi:hypothetical protein